MFTTQRSLLKIKWTTTLVLSSILGFTLVKNPLSAKNVGKPFAPSLIYVSTWMCSTLERSLINATDIERPSTNAHLVFIIWPTLDKNSEGKVCRKAFCCCSNFGWHEDSLERSPMSVESFHSQVTPLKHQQIHMR